MPALMLNKADNIDRLLEQLRPCSTGVLQLRRVSTRVNSPANEDAEVLDPVE